MFGLQTQIIGSGRFGLIAHSVTIRNDVFYGTIQKRSLNSPSFVA